VFRASLGRPWVSEEAVRDVLGFVSLLPCSPVPPCREARQGIMANLAGETLGGGSRFSGKFVKDCSGTLHGDWTPASPPLELRIPHPSTAGTACLNYI
jgi:hypothetical protein